MPWQDVSADQQIYVELRVKFYRLSAFNENKDLYEAAPSTSSVIGGALSRRPAVMEAWFPLGVPFHLAFCKLPRNLLGHERAKESTVSRSAGEETGFISSASACLRAALLKK